MKTVLTLTKILLISFGLLLFENAIIASILSNIHEGIIACYGFGSMFFIYGLFFRKINTVFPKLLIFSFWFGFAVLLSFICFLYIYPQSCDVDFDEDAIIVLGSGLRAEEPGSDLRLRLDCTIEYAQKNPNAIIIVSGGQGDNEIISEADAMYNYLVKNGVNPSNIIKEDKSTSTKENFVFSRKITDRLDNCDKIAFITSNYHILRSKSIAKQCSYSDISARGSRCAIYMIIPNALRECLAILKIWIYK